jgi:hypothetical protein
MFVMTGSITSTWVIDVVRALAWFFGIEIYFFYYFLQRYKRFVF